MTVGVAFKSMLQQDSISLSHQSPDPYQPQSQHLPGTHGAALRVLYCRPSACKPCLRNPDNEKSTALACSAQKRDQRPGWAVINTDVSETWELSDVQDSPAEV